MTTPAREEKLNAWLAAERALRATLGAPGSMSLAQVSELQPEEFFDRIASGELPSPPFGHLLDFIPLEWAPLAIAAQRRRPRAVRPAAARRPRTADRTGPGHLRQGLIPIHLLITNSRTAMRQVWPQLGAGSDQLGPVGDIRQ